MISRFVLRTTLLFLFCTASVVEAFPVGNAEIGKELYWHGKSATGESVQATVGNDIEVSGEQFSCVNCHRPSGFGSSEGGKYVPPITGPILFSARQLDRNRIYMKLFEEAQPPGFATDVRKPRMRPGYNAETLAEALNKGIDPAGRQFDPQMPRYDLNDSDVANLSAYLQTLSKSFSPGVDSKEIHFATVVNDAIDPREHSVFINTVSAFFDWMNRATHGYQSRPGFSPYHMSELASAFRQWRLHVWELHGPPETWQEQLMRHYQSQPVFAVVSGLIQGPWRPIGMFCYANILPCIFPNTELPDTTSRENDYSIYFSRGLELEAEVLAKYLGRNPIGKHFGMLWSADPYGSTPALAFKQAISRSFPKVSLDEHEYSNETEFNDKLSDLSAKGKKIDTLVLWPGNKVGITLAALKKLRPKIRVITLPSAVLVSDKIKNIDKYLSERLLFAYPYELPSTFNPQTFRVRQWMHSQHLDITDPRLQYQTYYAMTLAEFALDQILDDFYRDYFIEAIEHLAENNLNIGTHPALALGPGQRFASKGAYVVRIRNPAQGGIVNITDWIVP